MPLIHPYLNPILKSRRPNVVLLGTDFSTTDLTTYTFTTPALGIGRGYNSFDRGTLATPDYSHLQKASNGGFIVVFVHAEDAATLFNISSVTIGGVSGVEQIDRGGVTSAINSGMYSFSMGSLDSMSGTDIVVTMSEAVTCCGVGVALVTGFSEFDIPGIAANSTAVGTGTLTLNSSLVVDQWCPNSLLLVGATCATQTENVQFDIASASGCVQPTLLYDIDATEIRMAAAWTYNPGYSGGAGQFGISVSFDGATAGDAVSNIVTG